MGCLQGVSDFPFCWSVLVKMAQSALTMRSAMTGPGATCPGKVTRPLAGLSSSPVFHIISNQASPSPPLPSDQPTIGSPWPTNGLPFAGVNLNYEGVYTTHKDSNVSTLYAPTEGLSKMAEPLPARQASLATSTYGAGHQRAAADTSSTPSPVLDHVNTPMFTPQALHTGDPKHLDCPESDPATRSTQSPSVGDWASSFLDPKPSSFHPPTKGFFKASTGLWHSGPL